MTADTGTRRVQVGLNMHRRWLSEGPAHVFLAPLRELGLSILEFKVDSLTPDWSRSEALIEECEQLGFNLSFHAPHGDGYSLTGFSRGRERGISKRYAPAVDYVVDFADRYGPTTLVVHGAKGRARRRALRRDTVAFARWLLGRSVNLRIAIEVRIRERGAIKVGDSRAELVELVSELDSERVGICWDMGHDARNDSGFNGIDDSFLSSVTHVHVHDMSPDGRDHCPLLFDNVPYQHCLTLLLEAGYQGSVVLEIDGHLVAALAEERRVSHLYILQRSLRKLRRLTVTQTAGEAGNDPRAGADC